MCKERGGAGNEIVMLIYANSATMEKICSGAVRVYLLTLIKNHTNVGPYWANSIFFISWNSVFLGGVSPCFSDEL